MAERIVEATVDLHAEHGALGTSYAMIAEKAGVSPQTVYNHFPTLGHLIGGCTGHVLARAPRVDAACFAAGATPAARLRLLAAACYRQLAYLAPWLRLGWGEAELVPELDEVFERGRAELRELLELAVSPQRRAMPEFLDAAALILDYPAWKALTNGRTQARAADLAGECLAALLPALTQPKRRSKS